MEQKNKSKVRYEFYKYDGTNPLQPKQYTLVIGTPAKITFTYLSGFPGDVAIINRNFFLNSVTDTNNGTAQYPSTLVLENNKDEIDVTNYSIIVGIGTLVVVCKYYVNE
jgi:hypothetical protein